jgi:hypothetical protein
VVPSDVGQDLFGWSTAITCVGLYRVLSTCARPLGHFSGTSVPDSAGLFVQVDRGSWCGRRGSVVAVLSPSGGRDPVLSAVTLIVAVIVALTFLFGFGNVFTLALRLGVPVWVAPLVAPAVDLSVVGLLIAIRSLSMRGAPVAVIRPARRLLLASSVVTLALNVAEPLIVGEVWNALFDAVGPLLLIGWAEVGPTLLYALASVSATGPPGVVAQTADSVSASEDQPGGVNVDDELLERARQEDRRHRERYQRPVSAENLRKTLGVGAERSRTLVKLIRAEHSISA